MNLKQRQEIGMEVLVGLFMFTVLIALGVFTIVLSRDNMFKDSYSYNIEFSEISGLREGDDVYMRGMKVGRVKRAALENGNVMVEATLDVPIQLREGYSIEVTSSSMLGGKYLKIFEGPKGAEALPDGARILGEPPIDLLAEMGKVVHSLQGLVGSVSQGEGTIGKLMLDDTVYNNLKSASDDFAVISDRIVNGEGTLGRLLSTDDSLYDDLSETMASLNMIFSGLNEGEGTIGRLLTEDELYDDAAALMSNLRIVSDNLAQGKGMLGQLMSDEDSTYADLAATLAAIRSISESIDRGDGTIGRLVKDAELYDEATLLVEDIRAAVDDLREASPITSFGSVVFGAF